MLTSQAAVADAQASNDKPVAMDAQAPAEHEEGPAAMEVDAAVANGSAAGVDGKQGGDAGPGAGEEGEPSERHRKRKHHKKDKDKHRRREKDRHGRREERRSDSAGDGNPAGDVPPTAGDAQDVEMSELRAKALQNLADGAEGGGDGA